MDLYTLYARTNAQHTCYRGSPSLSRVSSHHEPGDPNNKAAVATPTATRAATATRRWHHRARWHVARPAATGGARSPRRRARRRPPPPPEQPQADGAPAHLPHLLRGGRRSIRLRAGGPRGGPALHAPGLRRLPLRVGRPGVARHGRALRRAPGQRRLRPLGRPRLRPARRLAAGDVEVPQLRHQHRRVPGARRRLPGPRHPRRGRRQDAHGHGGRHDRVPVLRQLRRPEHRRVGRRRAGARVPGAVRAHDRDRGAQDAAAAVGGAGGGEQGLAALLQHALLEPQLLGQRQHHGRRGGAAGAHVSPGAGGGGRAHRCQLPAAAHGSDRRRGRAAGHVGERLPGRCCRHHRRPMAQVLDRGRRGGVVRGHVRGPAEQRRVPAAGHGGAGPAPGRVRAPRHPVRFRHPVGGHRRLHGRHARRLLPRLRRRRRHRQLPLQPRHAAGVRRLPLAPRQAPRPEAALPRAAVVAARAGGHVRRAVGVPGVRLRRGRVEGVRARRRAHGARRRTARRHEAVQVQEVAQVQDRRGRRGGRSPPATRGCCRRFCWRPSLNE